MGLKDSGIKWIGKIPDEWTTKRFKYFIKNSNSGEVIDKEWWNIGSETLYTCSREPMNSNYDNFPDWKRTKEGDILLTRNGTPYIFLPPDNCIYSNVVQRLKLKDADIEFAKYYLLCASNNMIGNGDIIPSFNMEIWGNIYVSFPKIVEQKIIVEFLNDKVAKIDDILWDLNKQVEILNQYKKSLITETVTHGLNPNVEMKDSGIDWIGAIPNDWNIKKLRYLGDLQNGISKGGEFFGSGYPFVSYGDVYNNITLPETIDGLIESTKAEQNCYSVKKNDAFFTRTSETIEEIGFTSVCEKTIDNATFAGFLIRFRPITNLLNMSYAKYYFRAEMLRAYFVKEMMIVTRASLGQDLLKNLPVLLPSLDEQKEIANYLDKKCAQIDDLISDKQAQIEKMENYKKSLIYEYVTGKKRVKGAEF